MAAFNTMTRAGLLLASLVCMTAGFAQSQLPTPVTTAMLQQPPEADWLMWRRTLDSWGYSPLKQIDRTNVAKLKLVWSAALNKGAIQEGTPLVHDGVLYMPHPGDVISAHDAVTGKQLWEYRRKMPEDLGDYISANVTTRTVAMYGSTIFHTSNDDYVVAIDAVTGKQKWQTQVVDYREHPSQQSNGPVIIKGKVISGRNCQPSGGPEGCVITAHDPETGKELWRLSTIEKPGGASDSWGGLAWEKRWHVGAWMMPSYDPELDLIYFGTSVTAPAPKFLLSGNDKTYLYHNSTLAIDPDDGKVVWHYQHLVDHWDLDHPFERLLVDTEVAPDPAEVAWISPDIVKGKKYKVMTGIPGKTGVVYTLDRTNGKFLWARPTVKQNVVASIDGKTGVATVNPATLFHAKGDKAEVCPALTGGKNWWAGAYSPLTNMMYYGLQNTCAEVTVTIDKQDPDALYGTSGRDSIAAGAKSLGTFYAVSAQTGKTGWTFDTRGTALSVVTTGGGLVFGGDLEGNFRAFDQVSGKVLWEVNLGSSVTGYPITFAAGGKQYVVASTGGSVTTSTHRRLLGDVKAGTDNQVYVFALP